MIKHYLKVALRNLMRVSEKGTLFFYVKGAVQKVG